MHKALLIHIICAHMLYVFQLYCFVNSFCSFSVRHSNSTCPSDASQHATGCWKVTCTMLYLCVFKFVTALVLLISCLNHCRITDNSLSWHSSVHYDSHPRQISVCNVAGPDNSPFVCLHTSTFLRELSACANFMNGEMPWWRFIWIPSNTLFKPITFCNFFVCQDFYCKSLSIILFENI